MNDGNRTVGGKHWVAKRVGGHLRGRPAAARLSSLGCAGRRREAKGARPETVGLTVASTTGGRRGDGSRGPRAAEADPALGSDNAAYVNFGAALSAAGRRDSGRRCGRSRSRSSAARGRPRVGSRCRMPRRAVEYRQPPLLRESPGDGWPRRHASGAGADGPLRCRPGHRVRLPAPARRRWTGRPPVKDGRALRRHFPVVTLIEAGRFVPIDEHRLGRPAAPPDPCSRRRRRRCGLRRPPGRPTVGITGQPQPLRARTC